MNIQEIRELRALIDTHGPDAALPRNLSDLWLKAIVKDIIDFEDGEKCHSHESQLAAPVLLIYGLIGGWNSQICNDELAQYYECLRGIIFREIAERFIGYRVSNYKSDDIFL